MTKKRTALFAFILPLFWLIAGCDSGNQWELLSPDENLKVTLSLQKMPDDTVYPANSKRLYYEIKRVDNEKETTILPLSPLGIAHNQSSFIDSLTFAEAFPVKTIDETYKLLHGKHSECRNYANEQTFVFQNSDGKSLEVVFRAYNDGIAFRYRFPGTDKKQLVINNEITGFCLPKQTKAWLQPYDIDYESYFSNGKPIVEQAGGEKAWSYPALFQNNGNWLLITEAALDSTNCGMHLENKTNPYLFSVGFPRADEVKGLGAQYPSASFPWQSAWRVVITGQSLHQIVETSMITDLNPKPKIDDLSWIRPGRAAWIYWSDNHGSEDYVKLCEFVDLAADMHWEYMLVDAGWDKMQDGSLEELVKYAGQKGIKLWVWYNSGGEHNDADFTPRDRMHRPEQRKKEMEYLQKLGIAGIKVDFFLSEKQMTMKHYIDILEDAAEHQLMVNFHGSTFPRGWQRTYPHLMTMEGVKGAENYGYTEDFPEKAPVYNTIIPYTRNAIGSMDYTPVTFTNVTYNHITGNCHELAQSVVFESGIQHFADRPNGYYFLPDAPLNFLRKIPVAWDETRFVDGYPGKLIVIARRKNKEWYVGALNGEATEKNIEMRPSFLSDEKYTMLRIADGVDKLTFRVDTLKADSTTLLKTKMIGHGGFVMRFIPSVNE